MKRLTKIAAGTAVLAGLVMAIAPWTVSSGALNATVAEQMRDEFGLDLAVDGRTTIAFLPVPRVKFDGVTLRGAGGAPVARGGQLRGQLSLLPLLAGQIVLIEASLSNSRIDIVVGPDGKSAWDPALAALRPRVEAGNSGLRVGRLVVNHADVVYRDDATGTRNAMRDVNLVINWPTHGSTVEVGGAFEWRGENVQIALTELSPSALAADQRSPIELRLTSRVGRLTVLGSVSRGRDGPWFSGRTAFETRSLRNLLAWSGSDLPLGALIGPATLDGEVRAVGQVVSWPAVRLTLGGERLDGALTARIEGGRLAVNGTVAADNLDLTGFAAPFAQAVNIGDGWSTQPLDIAAATASELDLRLSSTNARVGKARLADVALNVMIKPSRIEATLGATLNGGLVKGRVSLAEQPTGAVEFKAQASSQVDVSALLAAMGSTPWMTGPADGQIAIESVGRSPAELARRANGRASLTARQGEFVGVSLEEALRRFERQPLSASLNLRHGRTSFREAQASLILTDGVGEITEASFTSAGLRGEVRGHVLAGNRTISAKAAVESLAPVGDGKLVSALAFDIGGTWNDVAIVPDAKALIQRSGAARLLLGPPPPPPVPGLPRIESSAQ